MSRASAWRLRPSVLRNCSRNQSNQFFPEPHSQSIFASGAEKWIKLFLCDRLKLTDQPEKIDDLSSLLSGLWVAVSSQVSHSFLSKMSLSFCLPFTPAAWQTFCSHPLPDFMTLDHINSLIEGTGALRSHLIAEWTHLPPNTNAWIDKKEQLSNLNNVTRWLWSIRFRITGEPNPYLQ